MAMTGQRGRYYGIALGLLLAAGMPSGRLAAQEAGAAPDARPWFVSVSKWAKWPTLLAAIGLTAAAITKKGDADDRYDVLQSLCLEDPDACTRSPNGTYANPATEGLFQETLRLDAQARRWMIGGQGFLFVSGGMFLIDLAAGSSKPKNIPFSGLEAYAIPGTVGFRWRF
jgi:hypothetical protein